MTFPANGANVKLGKGALFLDMLDPTTGLPRGEDFLGNMSAISITPTTSKVELFSSTEGSGGLVASNRTSLKYSVAGTLMEWTMNNLGLFLIGTLATNNQALGTAATKNFVNVALGRYYNLGALDVTSVVVLVGGTADASAAGAGNVGNGTMGTITRTNPKPGVFHITMTSAGPTAAFSVTDPDGVALSAGAVGSAYSDGGLAFTIADGSTDFAIGDTFTITESGTLVLGTDYDISSKYGTVHLLPAATAVEDGDDIFVTFNKPAVAGQEISIGTRAAQIGRLIYRADDANSDGAAAFDIIECWRCEVTPNGDMGLITTDYGSFGLQIDVLADAANHPTQQYGRLFRRT